MRWARRLVSAAPAHGWATRRWNEARLFLSTLACARACGPSRLERRRCGTAKRYRFEAPLPQEQLAWPAASSPALSLASWTKARGGRPRFQSGIPRCEEQDRELEPGSRNRSRRWSGVALCFFLPRLWRIADQDQETVSPQLLDSASRIYCGPK
jgi:hypothetical protein